MARFDAVTKAAVLAALLAICALLIGLQPDATMGIRAAAAFAFAVGWIAAGRGRDGVESLWLLLAPIFPILIFRGLGRQGPVADLVWMSGLTAALIRSAPWRTWLFPPLWTILLGGWGLTLALVTPVIIARELSFDLRSLSDFSNANSWAMLPAPQVGAWTLYVVHTQLLGLLWFEWAYQRFTLAPARPPSVVHALWIGVTLASLVALIQGTVDISLWNTPFWIDAKRATGTMLDANAYGTAAAVAGPVAWLALRTTAVPAALGLVVLAINWGGVWMSGSRTGALCALVGAAGLGIGFMRSRSIPIWKAAVAGVVAIGLLGSGVLLSRIDNPIARIADKEGRTQISHLLDRQGYGTIAVRMVRDYPVTGVGVAAYRYLAPDYWRVMKDMQLQVDNAQNWWRHQLAELGVAGSLFVMLWSAVIAWHVLFGRARPHDEQSSVEAWAIRGLLLGIGACSLVGMPTQNPLLLIWFFFLVAWMAVVCANVQTVPHLSPVWLRTGAAVAIGLALVEAGGHALLARGPLAVVERARRFPREYVVGAYSEERLPGGHPFHWTDDTSEFILPAERGGLVLRMWASHPDIAQHPISVTIASRCGVAFQRELGSTDPINVGVIVPEGVQAVDAVVTVSRTWRPSDYGQSDDRQLGIAVLTDFPGSFDEIAQQPNRVAWPACAR